jgi:hypothetical protein
MRVHKLLNGASLVSLSPHGFRFSDGTESDGQDRAFVDQFTLTKEFSVVREVGGMKLTRTRFVVCKEQKTLLAQVANEVTLVLVPFQFLQALQESLETGESFANVVAFNATKETTRSAPDQKVVDVNNWSVII